MRPDKEAMVWPERLKIPRSADASFWHAPCGCLPRKAMTTCRFVRSRGRRAWHRGSRTTISIPSRSCSPSRWTSIFDAAIEEYARQCAERFCSIFADRSLSLDEQLDLAFDLGTKREAFPYADFFHASEHGALHERLSLGICEAVRPSLTAALERDAATRGMPAPDAEMLAGMLVYGSIGLASGEQTRRAARRYVAALMKEFRHIGERKG